MIVSILLVALTAWIFWDFIYEVILLAIRHVKRIYNERERE